MNAPNPFGMVVDHLRSAEMQHAEMVGRWHIGRSLSDAVGTVFGAPLGNVLRLAFDAVYEAGDESYDHLRRKLDEVNAVRVSDALALEAKIGTQRSRIEILEGALRDLVADCLRGEFDDLSGIAAPTTETLGNARLVLDRTEPS